MQVYGKRPGPYQPALAGFGAEGDALGWRGIPRPGWRFSGRTGIFPLSIGHHYETTNIKLYRERYGDPQESPVVCWKTAWTSPACDQTRGDSAAAELQPQSRGKYLGFKRTLEEYGGD